MIRVLHSISNMDRAGIETMVMNFYRHMDRSLVQFDFMANKPKPGAYEDEIRQMGGRVFRSPGFNPLKYPKYLRTVRDIFQSDRDLCILHVHNGALGAYALLAGKLLGIQNRVYHAHGTKIPEGRARSVKALVKPLIDPLTKYKLACGTAAAQFYYHAHSVRRGEVLLIHNAIDVDRFAYRADVRDAMRREYELTDKLVIGHIGRFSAQKNHARLLKIFAALHERVPASVLVMIGEGDTRTEVIRMASELGLKDAVRLIPPVSCTDRWYQALDAFVLPSIWEGLPVVAVEAQASNLPCIFSSAVTQEAKVTENVRFVSLEETDAHWADEIQAALQAAGPRCGRQEALRAAGYDIVAEAKKLQDFYLKIAGKA